MFILCHPCPKVTHPCPQGDFAGQVLAIRTSPLSNATTATAAAAPMVSTSIEILYIDNKDTIHDEVLCCTIAAPSQLQQSTFIDAQCAFGEHMHDDEKGGDQELRQQQHSMSTTRRTGDKLLVSLLDDDGYVVSLRVSPDMLPKVL